MEERLIKIGITHGDINGIGYEIMLKTFSDSRVAEICTPVIYGSSKIAAYHRKTLGLPPLNVNNITRAEDAGTNRVNILNCVHDDTKVELSKPTEIAGAAAMKALRAAVSDLKRGVIDVLLTTPVNKHTIRDKESGFTSHSDYLAGHFGNKQTATLTVLIKDDLRIALATEAIPLAEIAQKITKGNLVEKLEMLNRSLIRDFNIVKPRIAVLSLNPHAEDAGLVGNEEESIIVPAMEEVEKKDIMVFGPYAAETFFGSRMYEKFDGVLAMYHDQGLVPFKTLAPENGFSYTAGLPIIHTYPIHGAEYDMAGRNIASEESFRQALYAALDIFRNRKIYEEATQNPLRKQYFEKGNVDEKLDLTKDAEDEML
ncbi:MAG: 4-hydroxythreonine-4-phosphate dehydrogenase PdxA [Tannerellaceae bacterium]|jgi:4-hydroxythreonine-4-phosphate dehydrogenase|nr:4-hydroxythreonine-4-phosphate dehydrogenase PdxA [Tannerellaceae bacterium]